MQALMVHLQKLNTHHQAPLPAVTPKSLPPAVSLKPVMPPVSTAVNNANPDSTHHAHLSDKQLDELEDLNNCSCTPTGYIPPSGKS
jgi:hypothetical protein